MSTAIGIILFVVGVGALILSVVLDRQPRRAEGAPSVAAAETEDRSEGLPEAEDSGAAAQVEPEPTPAAEVAEVPEVAPPPSEAAVTATPAPVPDAAAARAAAAEARLAKLRAELAGGPAATAAVPEPISDEVGPQVPDRGADAGRVFAAVASVGRAPEPHVDESEPEVVAEAPTAAEPEVEPIPAVETAEGAASPSEAVATEPREGHSHALPIVNHSDLVTHIRRQHPDLGSGGSTIQMRLIHERAHAAGP